MANGLNSLEGSVSELKDFGIPNKITTYEYVLWLGTDKGVEFLRGIESQNRTLGDYWTMHEAKSQITTKYAEFAGK